MNQLGDMIDVYEYGVVTEGELEPADADGVAVVGDGEVVVVSSEDPHGCGHITDWNQQSETIKQTQNQRSHRFNLTISCTV